MIVAQELPLHFSCDGSDLCGILHRPAVPNSRGVLVVVGGPQYRIGSHRQFVLLSRYLAAAGVPVLRFDFRGIGDSEGDARSFEDIDADIRAAVDKFFAEIPELKDMVIWGLCDAASAATFYGHQDLRITGMVLVNPWIRTEEGLARSYLKHYFIRRLMAPGLWRKIRRRQFDYGASVKSLLRTIGRAYISEDMVSGRGPNDEKEENEGIDSPLPDRMADGMGRFRGRVLIILSGKDLTAAEFKAAVGVSRRWRKLLRNPHISRRDLPEADHTFSRRVWRDQVASWTLYWLKSW